jgi:uncharacterized protein YkwD
MEGMSSRVGKLGIVVGLTVVAGGAGAGVAESVMEALQGARSAAGIVPLVRRADLDAVARSRAERVASLPHQKRLIAGGSIGKDLRRAGIEFRRVNLHQDLNRGYSDPGRAFVQSWSDYESSWASAVSEAFDSVGLATARADDGWIVLAVVLLEEKQPRPELNAAHLEALTVEAVNEARRAHGLEALKVHPLLVEAARAHSLDMIERRYFDHVAPDGTSVQDRVRGRGLEYGRIGENLHRSGEVEDPVSTAVESWLKSGGHRKLMLLPDFRQTGVGVKVDDESGAIYFTQVFLAPWAPPGAGQPE